MKILILGGTGAMGKPLVQILAQQGHEVYITTRKERKDENANIKYFKGDAHDVDFLQKCLCEEYDAIVDFMIYPTESFPVYSEMFLANTKQYIFISSARVYSDSKDSFITEDTKRLLDSTDDKKYLSTDEYALKKAREEDILQNGKHTNYTIVRPYITYNDERLQLGVWEKENWLYRALQGKTIVFSEDIAEKITTMTHGYDVALGIAALIGNSKAYGQAYHITTEQSIRWSDVLDIYLEVLEKHLGKKVKVQMLPKCDKRTEQVKYYQIYCDRLYNRRFSTEKLQRDCAFNVTFVSPQEGLRKCLSDFIINDKEFRAIDWIREGVLDRITGDKTRIKDIHGWKNKVKYILYRYIEK